MPSLPFTLTADVRTSDKVYIAPSGVQKERIQPTHIFVLPYPQSLTPDNDRRFLRRPTATLKESACTPLFWNAFDLRSAGSCIHTHSQNAVLATLLWTGPVFKISHQVSGPASCRASRSDTHNRVLFWMTFDRRRVLVFEVRINNKVGCCR